MAGFVCFSAGVPAGARPTADDVSIQVFLRSGNLLTSTPGPNFKIVVEIETVSGAQQVVRVTVTLPAGLRWGADAPDPSEGCTGVNPATCTATLSPGPSGTVGAGWVWDVVADQAGTYEITGAVEPTESDPALANNQDVFRFDVVFSPSGGGSPGSGDGTTAATAGALKLSPAKPKAGSKVTAAVPVSAGGTPVRPSGVRCTASAGSAKVRGVGRARSGFAACTYPTPISAKGMILRGSIAFTARGRAFTKRFSVRLS